MKKLFYFLRSIYHLLISFKVVGYNPLDCYNYVRFYFSKHISATEYNNYQILLKNKDFRSSFLSYGEAEKYWEILNPYKYAVLARDKYISHKVLENAGIPMPKLYAYYNAERGDSFAYIYKQLKDQKVKEFVVKPAVDSAHGSGVFVCKIIDFKENDCWIEKTNGEVLSLKRLLEENKYTPLLFESKVAQTKQMSELNISSVNTVRMMTSLYPTGEVKLFAAFMKMGRKGSDIDNAGDGGNVDCGVNVDTGICFNATIFDSFLSQRPILTHPDSGYLIEGLRINDWETIKKKVCQFQSNICYLKTIGWDVALTDEGPVIIEINNWWDTTGQLFIGRGWRDDVVDCYNAWNNYYQNKK